MKASFLVAAAAISMLATTGLSLAADGRGAVPNAQGRRCSNASLEGAYGFLDSHTLVPAGTLRWTPNVRQPEPLVKV